MLVVTRDMESCLLHSFYARDDRDLTVVICEYIEEVTLLCMDKLGESIEGSLVESEFMDFF